jgi:putative Ig domain-containing protein
MRSAWTMRGTRSIFATLMLSLALTACGGGGSSDVTPVSANKLTITGSPASSVTAGQAYAFTPSAAGGSGAAFTFSLSNGPAWATFSTSTGRLSGTPAAANVGTTSNILISVSDGTNSASLPSFSITVNAASSSPTISGTPPTGVVAGQAYSFAPTTSDPSGKTLSFSISNGPAWATFSTSTGQLSGTPAAANVGTYSNIVISVSDGTASASLPAFTITVAADPPAGAPVLLYTDIVSGSATNGENGKGAYLTLYGLNFGTAANMCTSSGAQVTIGGQAVANCRYLVPAKTNGIRPGFPSVYALSVQIGSSGVQGLTAGSTYPIALTVNGIPANTIDVRGNLFNFTIQPGHFWFVDTVNGSDSTGVVDDIAHPFRYIQKANGGSDGSWTGVFAPGNLAPGDTVVIRGNNGTPITDQVGYDGRLMRWHAEGGSAPTGAAGHGYVHFTSYPGPINGNAPEDVYIFTPSGGKGGFMGTDSMHARPNANDGQYWSVSNLRSSCASSLGSTDASNFNLQNSADHTRFVNLDVQWPSTDTGTAHQKAGGIVGNGDPVFIVGNYVHNISGGDPSALENHGIYLDGSNTDAHNVEVAFNVIINCNTGQCIQFHSEASDGFSNVWVHHNWSENSAKYNFKMDGWSGLMEWWDNVVIGSVREAFQIDSTGSTSAGVVHIENNTFYDGYSYTGGGYFAQMANEGSNVTGTFIVQNNIFAYSPSSSGYASNFFGSMSGITIGNNMCYDYSGRLTSGTASCGSGSRWGDPQFTNNATFPNSDVRLGTTSAAISLAISATLNPTNDLGMNPQPRAGQVVSSVGAFQ